jgi:hypothetical protein
MAWDTVPAPNYAAFQSDAIGNALSNLVGNYQQAQQGHPLGNYNYDPATGNLEPVR